MHRFANVGKTNKKQLDSRSREVVKLVHEGKLPGGIDPEMVKITAGTFMDAVFEGYDNDFTTVDFASPDFKMLSSLEKNVFHFSAAKNYTQLKEMSKLLTGDDGKVRPFKEFKELANKVNEQYNVAFLQSEYNLAIGSSTMAARWTDFKQNEKEMPYLQYKTAGDARVRESHHALDGVVRKIDDSFWNKYYPPNGWGCRCDVIQLTTKAHETNLNTVNIPEVPAVFQTNLAKQGNVFPMGSSYFKGLPGDVEKQYKSIQRKVVRTEVRKWAKDHIPETGKLVQIDKYFKNLTITRNDIKTITGKPHKNAEEIFRYCTNLPRLLNNSEYIISAIDNGNHPFVELWHYFKYKGQKDVYLNVMQTKKGKYRIHSIGDSFNLKTLKKPRKVYK